MAGPHPLGWGPAINAATALTLFEEHPVLENFFSALLALIAVAILAFTVLAVKKLYQGQN